MNAKCPLILSFCAMPHFSIERPLTSRRVNGKKYVGVMHNLSWKT